MPSELVECKCQAVVEVVDKIGVKKVFVGWWHMMN